MQIVNTYVGQAAPNQFNDALDVASKAAAGYGDLLQRQRVANAQALVQQIDGLNQQYGALAFQPPPEDLKASNRSLYDKMYADYEARGQMLGAAGQALKEAGGIKDPAAWQYAYLHGGISQQQEKNWQSLLRTPGLPTKGDTMNPQMAQILTHKQVPIQPITKAAATTQQSTDQEFPGVTGYDLNKVIVPRLNPYAALVPGLLQGQQLNTPESFDVYLPEGRKDSAGKVQPFKLGSVKVQGNDVEGARQQALQMILESQRAGTGDALSAPVAVQKPVNPTLTPAVPTGGGYTVSSDPIQETKYSVFLNGKKVAGPFNEPVQASTWIAGHPLPNSASGTGQQQLSPAMLQEWEQKTGDTHRPALVGDKELILNARAAAEMPQLAAAVAKANGRYPVNATVVKNFAGGKDAQTQTQAEADRAAVEANMEWFREQQRQRGMVPRIVGGEYAGDPPRAVFFPRNMASPSVPVYADGKVPTNDEWAAMTPQQQADYQNAVNARGQQQVLADAQWEVANLPSAQWSPATVSIVQQSSAAATGNANRSLVSGDAPVASGPVGAPPMPQAAPSQRLPQEPVGQRVVNDNGSLTSSYGDTTQRQADPTLQQPIAPNAGEPDLVAVRNALRPENKVTPMPPYATAQQMPVVAKAQPYVAAAQDIALKSKQAELAGQPKKADALMQSAVQKESGGIRATVASTEFKNFKQESSTAYRDWIDGLSQKELASYGLDDVAQAMDRQDNHALEVAKLKAQTDYWNGLLGLQQDAQNAKQSPFDYLLNVSTKLLEKMPSFINPKDGSFDMDAAGKFVNAIPAYKTALENLQMIQTGGQSREGIVSWMQKNPSLWQQGKAIITGQPVDTAFAPVYGAAAKPTGPNVSAAAQKYVNG